jgi:hypothetical protein
MNREFAHQIGYLPLLWVVFVVVVLARWVSLKKILPAALLVAAGLFVSYPWDSVVKALPIEDQYKPSYFFFPVQVWLVWVAFVRPALERLFFAGLLILLVPVSMTLSWPGPDYLLTLVGSAAILSVARGWLALPLWAYFFLGTLAYFGFAFGPNFSAALNAYQACRLTAFVLYIGIITPPVIRRWREDQWKNTSWKS